MKDFSKASNAPLSTNLRRTPYNCVSWNQNQISRDGQTEWSKISPGGQWENKAKTSRLPWARENDRNHVKTGFGSASDQLRWRRKFLRPMSDIYGNELVQ